MPKQRLQVFARIRPCYPRLQNLPILITNNNSLLIETTRAKLSSTKQQHEFFFSRIFEEQSTQQQIFASIAKPVIDNSLSGYNGTIFAYGQTGSGKTFTMSGGDEWEERGIIPRVLSYVFEAFENRKHQVKYELRVAYLEIYNESAYDLLDQRNGEFGFQQWPKVTFVQDDEKGYGFRNCSINLCKSEEQALDYFMMGNYMRKVSCTSMNQASSRSHCIFVLNIKGIDLKNNTEIYSKINLVDLAGSERVSKSHAQGIVLTEAKSINLSLSYLEQVIVSLNEKAKGKNKVHVPYRNSLLTTLLKDSLGGNCKTVMMATIASEMDNLDETISTLRFSQRVRQLKNQVSKNQKTPLETRMEMLERENMMLRKRLEKQTEQQLSRTDSEEIRSSTTNQISSNQIDQNVDDFINDRIKTIDLKHIDHANLYFGKMKELYKEKMREYVNELTFISEKIANYEEVLNQREKKCLRSERNIF